MHLKHRPRLTAFRELIKKKLSESCSTDASVLGLGLGVRTTTLRQAIGFLLEIVNPISRKIVSEPMERFLVCSTELKIMSYIT